MKGSTIGYFILDAFKSLRRNKSVSIAAMATVAATLFLLGIFLLSALNVENLMQSMESKLEIQVFLKEDITRSEQMKIENTIKDMDEVSEVKYETKSEALGKVKKQVGKENEYLIKGMEKDNPMPNSYILKMKSAQGVKKVVKEIKNMQGIDKIKDGGKIVDKIINVTKIIKWIGVVLFIIFMIVSLFLIGNTIKLTVYSRRREINIMKYVGATDWFVRWPFLIEGIIMGIIGALLATIILYYPYRSIFLKVSKKTMFMQLISPNYVTEVLLWQFMLGGIIIGALGSIFAIRKFLDV